MAKKKIIATIIGQKGIEDYGVISGSSLKEIAEQIEKINRFAEMKDMTIRVYRGAGMEGHRALLCDYISALSELVSGNIGSTCQSIGTMLIRELATELQIHSEAIDCWEREQKTLEEASNG